MPPQPRPRAKPTQPFGVKKKQLPWSAVGKCEPNSGPWGERKGKPSEMESKEAQRAKVE